MKYDAISKCILLIIISNGLCAQEMGTQSKSHEIQNVVDSLASNQVDIKSQINDLFESPQESARILIDELKVIPIAGFAMNDKEKHETSLHVIQCLRALRAITGGLDFKAEKTLYRFKKNEETRKNLLLGDNKENSGIPFFSLWMSRDYIFIAPMDVQKKIILNWKNWYVKEGKSFHYVNAVDDPIKWAF